MCVAGFLHIPLWDQYPVPAVRFLLSAARERMLHSWGLCLCSSSSPTASPNRQKERQRERKGERERKEGRCSTTKTTGTTAAGSGSTQQGQCVPGRDLQHQGSDWVGPPTLKSVRLHQVMVTVRSIQAKAGPYIYHHGCVMKNSCVT